MTTFYSVLSLLTGVGVFLVGIVMFSECLEKNASRGMRSLFKKISNSRAAGVGIGAGVTAIIQSSTATTVMVIGLVNAGILTLFQATAIIMGANIGTTVTGLLVSLSTFEIKYAFMAMAFAGAFVKLITKKDTAVKICDLLISFGILFVGLELMSKALSDNETLKNFFMGIFEAVNFPLLLILLGAVFTAVIQSSSASTAIFLTMIGGGLLDFDSALYLVLGANIGTCITALLASLTANTNSKRAALIHILFNFIGTIVFTALVWPLEGVLVPFYQKLIPDPVWQLSIFHVVFNVTTTLLLVWFIKPLNRLTCFLIKDKEKGEDVLRPTYIDERLLSAPPIAIEQTKKEIVGMAERARDNLWLGINALLNRDLADKEKIAAEEERINFLNRSLARYLVKLSTAPITYADEKLIGGFHHVINDVERIGDHAVNFLEDAALMKEHGCQFSEKAVEELKAMYGKISELFALSLDVFVARKPAKLKV
ncbi:MAG: Na/Pi cotransporter family protein, partial [Clostridiales bacterium]|nr:Na/Pi cotransporter family protein [Clostridiales bacterium]